MARLCDELIAHFRALMLIKSVKNPKDILVMSEDEFEEAQTQSDYLSLADIVYYMDVLSRAYQRMGRGTGDRTELEMAMVKLASSELDGTTEALTQRISALEKAVKYKVTVDYITTSETVGEKLRNSPSEASNKSDTVTENKSAFNEQKAEPVPYSAETDSLISPEKPTVPVAKPAPVPASNPARTPANLDEIYKNAKPFPEWVDVVSNMKPVSRAIAAAFSGSTAYVSGSYLLIDTSNEMAFELLKNGTRREEIRKIILETTGRVYKLGPYKRVREKKKETDPLDVLKNGLEGTGIKITEE